MSGGLVLVIEDHDLLRKALRISLQTLGCVVVEADRGSEGLAALAEEKPDLIVMDLGLPDGNGIDLVKQIRETRAGASVPVIALSGADESIERARKVEGGFVECMTKPVSPQDLIAVARQYLRRGPEAKVA